MDTLLPRAYQMRATTAPYPRVSDIAALHHKARAAFDGLSTALVGAYKTGRTETLFKPFETIRSPLRQDKLLAAGATKARGWQSAHQYGLATDFAAFVGNQWNWDAGRDWPFLKRLANEFGLDVPIKWDLGHVEHPLWWKIDDLVK